jgi:hypothetical protein
MLESHSCSSSPYLSPQPLSAATVAARTARALSIDGPRTTHDTGTQRANQPERRAPRKRLSFQRSRYAFAHAMYPKSGLHFFPNGWSSRFPFSRPRKRMYGPNEHSGTCLNGPRVRCKPEKASNVHSRAPRPRVAANEPLNHRPGSNVL